jgi:hypothetical protein
VLGFRQYVLTNNWHPENYPLAEEVSTNQLEMSNPSLGGGSQQFFRWKLLGYTKERGVFEEWCGVELQDVRTYAQSLYKQLVASEANQAPVVKQLQDELAAAQAKYDALVKNMEALLNPPKAA